MPNWSRLLPPELRNDRRAAALLLSATLTGTMTAVVALYKLAAAAPLSEQLATWLTLTCSVLTWAMVWMQRRAYFAAWQYFAGVSLAVPLAGVLGDPMAVVALPSLALLPVGALFVLGEPGGRHALYTTLGTVTGMAVFLLATGRRLAYPAEHDPIELIVVGTAITSVAALYVLVSGYQRSHEQSLQAIALSEARSALALRAEHAGVAEIDEEGKLVYASPRLRAMTRLPDEPAPDDAERIFALVQPEDRTAMEANFRQLLGGERDTAVLEVQVRLPGARPRWYRGDALAERVPGGRRRIVVVVRDITEARRVADLKDDFVATVSHELRTPLTTMLGVVGLLRAGVGAQVDPEGARLLAVAAHNGERLTALINDLLDVQRLEDGSLAVEIAPTDLRAVCAQVAEGLAEFAVAHAVTVTLEPGPPVRLDTDVWRCTQVVHNLVHNACKFSPRGGRVQVRAGHQDGMAWVEVEDNGPGIPEEFQEHVFDRFSQAWSGAGRPQGGTGLGLALSRGLAERLSGRIRFQSRPGKGTTFRFELPGLRAAA